MSYLLDDSTWIEQREVLITQLDLPSSGTLAVQKLSEDLSLSFIETQSNWDASNMARLEEINGEVKVVVSNLKKEMSSLMKKSLNHVCANSCLALIYPIYYWK